ncbi:MAG: Ig-like domain-containing protein, partial [Patescibacteria group bacterium]
TGVFKDPVQHYWCYSVQTEAQQAEFLFKRAIYQLCNNIKIVNWSTLGEKDQHDCYGRFTTTGLIYDGFDDECGKENDLYDAGKDVKKLSYYTYKLLNEKLKEVDFDNVKVVSTNIPNVYLYEFTKPEGSLYIAWWNYFAEGESGETKEAVLPVSSITTPSVKITGAIPSFPYDFQSRNNKLKENDYPDFFDSSLEPLQAGNQLVVSLGRAPVFIEGFNSLRIINPLNGAVLAPGLKVKIMADPMDLTDIKDVYFIIDGKRQKAAKKEGLYYYNWQVPRGFSQKHIISAQALDVRRNIPVIADPVEVYSSPTPVLSIVSPLNNYRASPGEKIIIQSKLLPANDGIIKVEFYIGNQRQCQDFGLDKEGFYTCRWNVPKESNQFYEIMARAYAYNKGVFLGSIPISQSQVVMVGAVRVKQGGIK